MEKPEDLKTQKKHPDFEIRQMEIDDLAAVFHLGERLFRAEKVPNLYRTWDAFEIISVYQGDPEFCLVAELDGQIIGFVLGTTIIKNHSAWKYGHLVWLGVDPDFQGKNIAKRLFNRFRDLMEKSGVRMLLVDTEADNLPALRFFQKMGFGDPQKHVYMKLNLATHRRILSGKKRGGHGQAQFPQENHG